MRNARTVSKTVGLTTVMVVVAMAAAGCTSDQPLDAETAAPTTAPVVTSIAASEATTSAPPATSASTSPPTSSTTSVAPTTAADTEPPPLVVTAPAGGATVTEAAVRFEGITEPGATVLAWDQWPATVAADGTWSIALILDPGTNVARFTATDAAGNVSIAEAVVHYEPPAPPTTTTTTASPPSPATVLITFHPAVVPDEHTEGSCSTHSFQAWRDDAYRCFTLESTIYDPCFDTGEHLICGADPITGNAGFVLDLTEPLPKEPPADDLHPWIIELADGMLCWGAGGATGNIDGRRLDWSCADGTWIVRGLEQAEIWTGQRVMMDLGGINVVTDYGFVPLGTVWL